MKKSHIILLLLALSPKLFAQGQQVIYVDASNNTGIEDGTQAHPFNTIMEGILISQNSDSIAVADGNYNEDTLLISRCVSIAGENPSSTVIQGIFILSSTLDTLPVLIRNLWCRNIMHNDSGYTQTPLAIMECGLQVLNDYTPSASETGRLLIMNCIAADSIHIESASCGANREVINCETDGSLYVRSTSSHGLIRLEGNQVGGSLRVITVSKSDTIFLKNNTVSDSLIVVSTASDPDVITDNTIGSGVRLKAVAHSGFQLTGNQLQNGSLSARYTALSESVMENNTFLNGGINFKAVSGDITIKENEIHTDGSVAGIRLTTTAGGYLENNSIILPYFEPSGLPFEEDTTSVCGINVQSTSFGGMKGNKITGGAYGVYLSAISSNDFNRNEIEDSHIGLYLKTVSGYVDSNMVENCIGDGMILDYQPEYTDTNAIYLNHNIIRNNGGHGIWTKSNCLMGNLKEPGTGFNILKDNEGYDLFVETPSTFVDTIWAQNNEWSHSTEEEVGLYDIYDANDDASRALVMYTPILPFGVNDLEVPDIVLYPNPTASKFEVQSSKFKISVKRVEIVDLSGKVVIEEGEGRRGEGEISADVSSLNAGIYFVRISLENQTIVKKIIKL